MANPLENIVSLMRVARSSPRVSPASQMPETQTPYRTRLMASQSQTSLGLMGMADPRRSSLRLRQFADNNELVRKAVNKRKNQIASAKWHIVRLDDPKKPPDPKVDMAIRDFLKYCNPTRISFSNMLKMVMEDLLILDAGVIEKVFNAGGDVVALWPVDAATIRVNPNWDGSKPNDPRYVQVLDGKNVAALTNEQMIYIMSAPRTWSPIGWSPVETLSKIIEAELYLEDYQYQLLRLTAPEGMFDLGPIPPDQVDKFREYYETEVAGTKSAMFVSSAIEGTGVKFIPLKASAREQERDAYHTWLAKKIAIVFELDPMEFGITAGSNRATAKVQQGKTDEGFQTLAGTIEEFFTRELVWHFDENHGFAFEDLTERDATTQATIDMQSINSGIVTVNEIRAREGLDPVQWGDGPYAVGVGPVNPETPPSQQDVMDQQAAEADKNRDAAAQAAAAGANDKPDVKPGSAKSALPFDRRPERLMRKTSGGYLGS